MKQILSLEPLLGVPELLNEVRKLRKNSGEGPRNTNDPETVQQKPVDSSSSSENFSSQTPSNFQEMEADSVV